MSDKWIVTHEVYGDPGGKFNRSFWHNLKGYSEHASKEEAFANIRSREDQLSPRSREPHSYDRNQWYIDNAQAAGERAVSVYPDERWVIYAPGEEVPVPGHPIKKKGWLW